MSDLPQFPLPDSERPADRPRSQFPSGGFGNTPSGPPAPLAPSVPPPPRSPAADGPPTLAARGGRAKIALIAGAGATMFAVVALVIGVVVAKRWRSGVNEDAIVRVVTGEGRGTGFFVQPPKGMDGAYVVTAYHVISSGQAVTIERRLQMPDHHVFVEAYPETELAAFDAEADLAVLHIKDVPQKRFEVLRLAEAPSKNDAVISAGFPPSGVAHRAELSTRPGRIDQLVKFDATDPVMGKVIAANKIEGLLVDTNLEPGFSGGPTVNLAGEVVGVNVLKDNIHRGQDGAVSVVVLRELLDKIKPYGAPTPQDAEALLKRVQEELMMLPVDDRAGADTTSFLSNAELPQIRAFLREMRSMEGDFRPRDLGKNLRLANHAVLGILLARLPGKSLETYQASSTRERISGCEDRTRGIERFLGSIGVDAAPGAGHDGDCLSYALRPLAWDIVASTIEWEGKVRDYKVMKLDAIDEESRIFQASVRIPGVSNLLPIHMIWEAGGLRLKLFDKSGRLYALEGARSATARDFEGTWGIATQRHPEPGSESEAERTEKVTVTISGTDTVSVVHQLVAARYAMKGVFRCNMDKTISTKSAQSLSGRLHNGIITGSSDKLEYTADGCNPCKLCDAPDRLFVLKRYGEQMLFYRTDGTKDPEAMVLTKQP
jgi:S1-C subfamily serine protease